MTAGEKNRHPRAIDGMRGVTLLELMLVIAIVIIVTSIGVISVIRSLETSRVTNGYNTALMALRQARETAISEKRIYLVTFNPTGSPAGTITTALSTTSTIVSTSTLPKNVAFDAEPGIPSTATTTPAGLGTGVTSGAICFDIGVSATCTNTVYFWPDGVARDANGALNNGVIYIARPGDVSSSRAITVLGTTGNIRGWQIVKNTSSGQYYWMPR